jgi:hypothetical protein
MTQTESRAIVRHLGGESGHRSFFGGTHSRTRITLLALFVVSGMILTPLIGWPGLVVALTGVGVTLLVTAGTHRGSLMDRHRKRTRWAARQKAGINRFTPFTVAEWDQLHQALADVSTVKRREAGEIVSQLRSAIMAMRTMPDGADGMGWLQCDRGQPGIAWHAPVGESQYLSVTFSVTGQLRGIESTAVMGRAAEGWGAFLASRAPASSLVGEVQITTRVLPSDTAMQEFWVLSSLDPAAPTEAVRSYEEVLHLTGQDAMVQRHLVTVSWPITPEFRNSAAKHGTGRDGWRALMIEEIAATVRGLTDARLGRVEPLTARQVAAVISHQQNPARPIDYVADIDPGNFGVPSHDEFSAHIVTGTDPVTSRPVQWWHRTAAIHAEALATAPRTQLWLLDLLIGNGLPFARTVSFHIHLIPASEAKAAARQDLVRDTAEVLSRAEAGQLDSDDTGVHLSAARRRRDDLISGSHHHGATWVGFVTVTERSREDLARASRQLEDTCATALGIERLDWLDSFQSAASGATWPIGRGLAPARAPLSAKFYDRLAGRSEKDALS